MSQIGAHTPDDLRMRKVELVLQQLEGLPTLPTVAVRLLNLAGNSETKIQEIVDLIGSDQSLTAKVLSLVGSAATGLRKPVTTVRQAVVMLGFEAIRNLALSVKVFEIFPQKGQTDPVPGEFNRTEFWKHALAVATAAEMLATRCKPALTPQDAFVCGLLHDLGKVALDTVMPKSYARVVEVASLTRGDIADAERRIIGLDHGVAGKRVAETWRLPALITQAIWLHATAPMSVPQGLVNPAIVQLVGLSDLLARRMHIGFSGNFLFAFEPKHYLQPLGLTDADLAAVTDKLAEMLEARAKAMGLYDVQSRQIYLQSIANANEELGRTNQVLAAQNRKLAQRSDCFELLTRLYQRIGPTATPGQILTEIGHAAYSYFQTEQLVLFSQDPEQRAGEVVLFDKNAGMQENFLMPMPSLGGDQRVGRNGGDFIRPASPQLDWLLDRADTMTTGRKWTFMPLICGGQPVGGILWPEKPGLFGVTTLGDLALVSQSWGVTLRSAQEREQHNVLTEALAASNRELATLQQQLVRAKSLVSLGEMAAGAAHEMNNPLAVVCGRAQLLATRLSEPALKQDAQQIAQQGQRLSQIITDLMEFAKPTAPRLAPCSIQTLAQEAITEAQQRVGAPKVTVRLEAAEDLPSVALDARQIRAALAEVVLNAIQAGAGEGARMHEVTVSVRHDALDERLIVQVTDHGIGMSEETMRQAFAPFFSAKPAGRQRGMGLAKALRWVELHGGTIRLDSMPNAGTTAVVILPLTPAPAPQTPVAPEPRTTWRAVAAH